MVHGRSFGCAASSLEFSSAPCNVRETFAGSLHEIFKPPKCCQFVRVSLLSLMYAVMQNIFSPYFVFVFSKTTGRTLPVCRPSRESCLCTWTATHIQVYLKDFKSFQGLFRHISPLSRIVVVEAQEASLGSSGRGY